MFIQLKGLLKIGYYKFNSLSEKDKILIDKVFKQIYKRTINEHILEWAEIDWVIIGHFNRKIVSMCYIVNPTHVFFDKKIMKISGLGGVLTLPSYRRLGFTKKVLEKANQVMFEEQGIDCALLICGKSLVEIYNKFDWYELDCSLFYNNGTKRKEWKNSVMLKSNKKQYYPKLIEVNGKLW